MTHQTPLPAVDADVAALREALSHRPTLAFAASIDAKLDYMRVVRDFHEDVGAVATPDRLERILTALSAAQARAEAVEKDAERYRWLRDPNTDLDALAQANWGNGGEVFSGPELDAAIDAAITTKDHK